MKQGMAGRNVYEPKTEPKAKIASVAYSAELGILQHRTKSLKMYNGRGYEAPMDSGNKVHNCGSQGRHK